jgi:hypothetical protein
MRDSITKHEENTERTNDSTEMWIDHNFWQNQNIIKTNTFMEQELKECKKVQGGQKYSQDKAPMGTLLKQFRLALEAVAMRSKIGHETYKETDQDWMNFKRVPDAIEQYTDGTARHLAYIGEDETELGHEAATAWNALARLQLILEKQNG